ncbi:RrF2 family transcriptional regulator [Pseudooceanicola sp. C21-150M6]|uniref:RrF2 family transcriptional regulator n=1 Tax=Pseudooceanicola sp. C21-150M6 TaxID=3434355 RepID=UPI003D7F38CF
MRLTKRADLSMRVLMYCGVNDGQLVTKSHIAEACNTSENHLAQVVNRLAQLGFLHTQRGRNGGLRLSRPMQEIKVGEVFRTMEEGVPVTECFDENDNTCPLYDTCKLRDAIAHAMDTFYLTLGEVALSDLVCGNNGLMAMLTRPVGCNGARATA